MSAGRPAAQPAPGYEPPPRLFLSDGHCRVRFYPQPAGEPTDFDLAGLALSRPLQTALATAFDRHVGPSGEVTSEHSARNVFRIVKLFADVIVEASPAPQTPAELHPSLLDRFVLKRSDRKALPQEVGLIKAVLRKVDGLDPQFRNALIAPTLIAREFEPRATSFTEDEERRVLKAARTMLRQAAERIRSNRVLLERWRTGEAEVVDDRRLDEYCQILDQVERIGVLKEHPGQTLPPWLARHGSLEQLMHAIHPRTFELAAGALLLVRMTGLNGSTICAAPAAHHRPDGYSGATASVVVDLVKNRRGPRRYMTIALTDLPSWAAPPADRVELSGHDELHTPFGVYMLLLDLASAGRAITGAERLMVSWQLKGGMGFRVGLRPTVLDGRHGRFARKSWTAAAGLTDLIDGVEVPMSVTFERMRKTHLQREQRPAAHTEKTLAEEYLVRDATAFDAYRRVVAAALEGEVAKAQGIGRIAALTDRDVQEALGDPEAAARRHKVSVVALKRLLSKHADTVLAGCADHAAGPYDPPGEPCTASFLKCLECPCARALPHHLPIQAIALDAIEARRGQLTPLRWAQRFGRAHAQLSDLLRQAPLEAVAAARGKTSEEDHQLVERLLGRELDAP